VIAVIKTDSYLSNSGKICYMFYLKDYVNTEFYLAALNRVRGRGDMPLLAIKIVHLLIKAPNLVRCY